MKNIYKKIFFLLITTSITACTHSTRINTGPESNATLSSAAVRGSQFGPVATEIFNSINNIGGCGSSMVNHVEKSPLITKSADLRDKNGVITNDFNAATFGVDKCVGR